jgi:23S rRNA pseudouridine1911/1915/1917 synthase
MPSEIKQFTASVPEARLDLFLTKVFPAFSRGFLQKLIQEGRVTMDGKVCLKPSKALKPGVAIVVEVPEIRPLEMLPEAMPIPIIYQDEDIAVVDKPPGMSVHPGAGISTGTLVNALLFHLNALSGIGGVERPGIVHRLDKDTSGLMVIAKNDLTHRALVEQFAGRQVKKTYLTIVHGIIKQDEFTVDVPIGRDTRDRKKMTVTPRGRMAITDFEVGRKFYPHACLLYCHPLTGRTHQIRVHLASQKHPVVGDKLYGGSYRTKSVALLKDFPRQALHALELKFRHPRTGRSLHFTAPVPADMEALLAELEVLPIAAK